MNWYLVMSKPREEERAYENLVYQQYNCYLPKVKIEKIKQGKKIQLLEPLFPRYLFVQLNSITDNWGPVRSTLGVSNMVRFGDSYAKVPDSVIEDINYFSSEHQESLFKAGEKLVVKSGPFKGQTVEFLRISSDYRAMVLLELCQKLHCVSISLEELH